MTSRRAFVAGALSLLGVPLDAETQTARKVPSIGYLCTYPCGGPRYQAFVDSLEALGYVNGRTVDLIYPGYATSEPQDLNQLSVIAADMVRKKVDLIFAAGDVFAARAAKQATSTIPIVMAISGDPVKLGLVTSLARPGGNLTGITYLEDEIVAKQIELLKEIVPALSRVGVLVDSADPALPNTLATLDAVARSVSVGLNTVQVRGPTNFEAEFAMLTSGGARAFVVLYSPHLYWRGSRIAALAEQRRLVGVASYREFTQSRGSLSYGPRISDVFQRAASLIDQILKGARPANLPVERPTRFELVVNLLVVKDLGLTIPPSVLARADEVIQ
jgi:ABC-type uncharacterized transport system substrate-binding protein